MSGRVGNHLGHVQEILQSLKGEVADLRSQVKEAGSTFFSRFAAQLSIYDGALRGLTDTLATITACMKSGDGDSIPEKAGILSRLSVDCEDCPVEEDVGKVLRHLANEIHEAKLAYHAFSVAAKDVVNDADKMDIVVKACQAEFIKLKLTTNNIKARLNAHRLKLISKGRAFHEWAEMVHFETIECLRRDMDELEDDAAGWRSEHAKAWAKAQADWDLLMNGNRRIKVEAMLRKMKNSRAACAFSTWVDTVWALKAERAEAERQALLDEYQKRFAHLSAEQIEAKLREFIKRWKNAKVSPGFRTWTDMVYAAKQARINAELEAELAAMRAKLAQMHDNSALQKLKLYFQRKLQGVKFQSFKALCVNANQAKARKLLDTEAGKRIKAFLKQKLAGIGRRCWQAWLQHHDNIACENIKNNENAKKVALMLEKIARSLVHRQFQAFVRHHSEAAEERAAADALAKKLAMMDDLYKAKLRVFLDAKRLGKLSTFFTIWSDETANRGQNALLAEIDKEDMLMAELQKRLAEVEIGIAGQGRHAGALAKELHDLQAEYDAELRKHSSLESNIKVVVKKTGEVEDMAKYERSSRQGILDEISGLEGDLNRIRAECNNLQGELSGIGAEVGFVHETSYDC